MPMIRFVFALAALVIGTAGLAQAQTRDIYTVRGIEVEETADTVIAAQQQAFASARIKGAYELINRLTLPEDRQGKLMSGSIDPSLANRLAAAVDVEEETRGGGRYVGKLAIVYNPSMMRQFFEDRAIPYVDQPAPKAVLFPVSDRFAPSVWADVWPEQSQGRLASFETSLSPMATPESGWAELQSDVQAAGARRGIKAVLRGSPGAFRVDLMSVTPAGETQLGSTGSVATLEEAVEAAAQTMDHVWKQQSVIRSDKRTPARSSVLFTSLSEWNSMRTALSRSPLVSDFAIEGLSRKGAVVKFVYAGEAERLASNLRERGIALEENETGWIMRSTQANFETLPKEPAMMKMQRDLDNTEELSDLSDQ